MNVLRARIVMMMVVVGNVTILEAHAVTSGAFLVVDGGGGETSNTAHISLAGVCLDDCEV